MALFAIGAAAANAAALSSTSRWVPNGPVRSVALDSSGRAYLGGAFSEVKLATGTGMVAGFDGAPDPAVPEVDGGEVEAVAADGSGGWFIGGDFSSVGGVKRSRLAHIRADGTLDPTWNPGADGDVLELEVAGAEVYVGGSFSTVGGEARSYIARLSSTGTGAADPIWDPSASGGGGGGGTAGVITIIASGSDVYVGGDFAEIGGQPIADLAKVSATGTGAVDPSWTPSPTGGLTAPDDLVSDLALSGSGLFVAGFFGQIGGQPRTAVAKISAGGTGAADPVWNPNPTEGLGAIALALSGSDLYVGGQFGTIGGTNHRYLAKLSTSGTGAADPSWAPQPNNQVNALALSGSDLYASGSFTSIGGQTRRVAKLSTSGTGTADPAWNTKVDGDDYITALATSGSDVYVGGTFKWAGGAALPNLARLNADGTPDANWNPAPNGAVNAVAVSGSNIYVGGVFTSIGGQSRAGLAKVLDAAPGPADATWNPNPNGAVTDLAPAGSDVFAAGAFTTIGGQARNHLAKLPGSGSGVADAIWNPAPNGTVVALDDDGQDLYAAGSFNTIGGQNRAGLAQLSASGVGAADTTWNPAPNGAVDAITVSGSDVYAGGAFSSIGGHSRNHLARLASSGSGAADATWDADADGEVDAIAVSGSDIYAGGAFSNIGGETRHKLARLSAGDGTADPDWDPSMNSSVVSLAASDTDLVAGGPFSSVGPYEAIEGVALFDIGTPSISISSPSGGAVYSMGQAVDANFTCADEPFGSGISDCAGPVESGAPIDTATPGAHTFTVLAEDAGGNTNSQSITYSVTGPASPASPAGPTGRRAAALKKCKKKHSRKSKRKCKKKAKKLPL
jgi:beta-propeller uncharacterized protein DUF5122